jgi:hypothetical protein
MGSTAKFCVGTGVQGTGTAEQCQPSSTVPPPYSTNQNGNSKGTCMQVSDLKSELDQCKGATLNEISAIVTQINDHMKQKKSVLAPKIKDVRSQRAALEELKQQHSEAHAAYVGVLDAQESQFGGLVCSVDELQRRVTEVRPYVRFIGGPPFTNVAAWAPWVDLCLCYPSVYASRTPLAQICPLHRMLLASLACFPACGTPRHSLERWIAE